MIAGLRGAVVSKSITAILVDVGGVIYEVGTSANTIAATGAAGDPVTLHTHLVVREDALSLYGFAERDELVVFETLIGITGVGPRLACAVLSRFAVDQLHGAIESENTTLLATVPGIGRKTAARLILELRGKLPSFASGDAAPPASTGTTDDAEVVEALRSLGYTLAEAHLTLSRLDLPAEAPVEDRLVAALRILGEP